MIDEINNEDMMKPCLDDKISHPLSSDVGGRGNLVIFYREARDCITSSQNFDCLPHTQPGNP